MLQTEKVIWLQSTSAVCIRNSSWYTCEHTHTHKGTHAHTVQRYAFIQIRENTDVGPMLEFYQLSTIKGFT